MSACLQTPAACPGYHEDGVCFMPATQSACRSHRRYMICVGVLLVNCESPPAKRERLHHLLARVDTPRRRHAMSFFHLRAMMACPRRHRVLFARLEVIVDQHTRHQNGIEMDYE